MFGFAKVLFVCCCVLPLHPETLKESVPQLAALMKLRRLIFSIKDTLSMFDEPLFIVFYRRHDQLEQARLGRPRLVPAHVVLTDLHLRHHKSGK